MEGENDLQGCIAVTGLGLATSLGLTLEEHVDALRSDRSGIGPLARVEAPEHCCASEASVPEFDVGESLKRRKNAKFMTIPVRCAVRAAVQAVRQSKLKESDVAPENIAVYTGSGQTGLEPELFLDPLSVAWEGEKERDYKFLGGRPSRMIDRYFSLKTLSNIALGLLSTELEARGPGANYVHGEIAAALALENACHDLREGRCEFAVAGGYDSLLNLTGILDHSKAGLLSPDPPDQAYRPFAADSNGIVLGEGAGFFVLELLEHAQARRAEVLGEIVAIETAMGVGVNEGSEDELSEYEGAAGQEMKAEADARGMAVDFVVARGLGSPHEDRRELRVLSRLVSDAVPVTALKSRTGYLSAATLAVELGLSLLFARAGFLPSILRLESPDPGCRADLVRGEARALPKGSPTGLLLARSLAGQEAAILMKAAPGATNSLP